MLLNTILNLLLHIDSFIISLLLLEYLLYFSFLITNELLLNSNTHFIYYKFEILQEPINNFSQSIPSNDIIVNINSSDNPYIINNNNIDDVSDSNEAILIFNYNSDEKDNYLNNNCVICLEEYNDDDEIIKVKCNHLYHMNCYDEFVKTSQKCGICRESMI